ncbi:hypothetical protein D623_10007401 [Myotis brandtii]|uniref:Uncharacterized protein n=1 Tax=Myotis brandtii TaxID=109478 RepID=S7NPB8_MYOBR|nr:hypothetical protein D623_10007401 [Myotis brandtii]
MEGRTQWSHLGAPRCRRRALDQQPLGSRLTLLFVEKVRFGGSGRPRPHLKPNSAPPTRRFIPDFQGSRRELSPDTQGGEGHGGCSQGGRAWPHPLIKVSEGWVSRSLSPAVGTGLSWGQQAGCRVPTACNLGLGFTTDLLWNDTVPTRHLPRETDQVTIPCWGPPSLR